jgi:hypothetical protein
MSRIKHLGGRVTTVTTIAVFTLFAVAGPAHALPSAIDPCLGVNATKVVANGLLDNVTNFFKYYGPRLAIALIIIGFHAAAFSRGSVWLKRGAIVLLGLALLTIAISVSTAIGPASTC